jgi:hypothetical protein
MTARDERAVRFSIIHKLNENPDGMCVPIGILGSRKRSLPKEILDVLPERIITAWRIPNDGLINDWLKMARIYYPNIVEEDIVFRSSLDDCLDNILKYTLENKCPVLFCTPNSSEAEHAISVNIQRSKKYGTIIAEMYGLPKERPIINVSERKVIRDLDNMASDFLNNDSLIVIFPPESEMKFDVK